MNTPQVTSRAAAIAVAAITALTPALIAPAVTAAKPATPARACFWSRNIDGFNAPDDRTVYLRVGVRTVYEVKLFAPCPDVDWNQRIALVSRGSSWICEGSGAVGVDIITRSATGRQRCPVTSIRRLTPQEVEAMPKKWRP